MNRMISKQGQAIICSRSVPDGESGAAADAGLIGGDADDAKNWGRKNE